jgi:hypothetical protein
MAILLRHGGLEADPNQLIGAGLPSGGIIG